MNKEELKARTKSFALEVIALVNSLPKTKSSAVIGRQVLRSATSVGANYRSALRGKSLADFIAKMRIVEEELDESIYWLELMVASGDIKAQTITGLLGEAEELLSIFVATIKSAKKRA